MRKMHIDADTPEQALEQAPWAAEIIEVEGGHIAFEDVREAEMFRAAD